MHFSECIPSLSSSWLHIMLLIRQLWIWNLDVFLSKWEQGRRDFNFTSTFNIFHLLMALSWINQEQSENSKLYEKKKSSLPIFANVIKESLEEIRLFILIILVKRLYITTTKITFFTFVLSKSRARNSWTGHLLPFFFMTDTVIQFLFLLSSKWIC